ncbi:phytoene/squalene synthase family protein [Sulfuriroseicoccus oceanibius]|uniref:Squalene/phytoene synthase family protein n=1 Tax=Sulfuriroseicoccus oceanibius TaxID=2707525 RepID=A0A6B3LCW3_9BACT|nr:squalene/phytoene synthase family protein [Sulfuriroseicoccus oceanibius]QQL44017.1 squalene/phytoene synthase family protein [Sulfuriroseicoccus oceanibius]
MANEGQSVGQSNASEGDHESRDALAITRRAKSNLAFALARMPKVRRQDMITFYAFCRVIDDIADDEGIATDDRRRQLSRWMNAVAQPTAELPEESLEHAVADLRDRYDITTEQLQGVVEGVSMDLEPLRFETAGDLEHYCYHVASLVGLVSIEVFGYTDRRCHEFAVQLGYALQWTNIIRDVATDVRNGGRIYLPMADLRQFGVTPEGLENESPEAGFAALMEHQYQRAVGYYDAAMRALPEADRRSMRPALVMARIYRELLEKIRNDGFRVFSTDYRLSRWRKLWLLLTT